MCTLQINYARLLLTKQNLDMNLLNGAAPATKGGQAKMEEYQKYVLYFIKGLIILAIIFAAYLFLTKIIFYVMPFLIGWLLASIINPIVNYIERKTRIPRGFISILVILLFFSIIVFLAFLGTSRLTAELKNISAHLPQYTQIIEDIVKDLIIKAQNIYFNLPPRFTQIAQENVDSLVERLTNSLSNTIGAFLSYLTLLPKTLIFIIVIIIAAFLISKDMKIINNFFKAQIPDKLAVRLKSVEMDLLKATAGFIKAQLKLMVITFIITITGLHIIGAPYALTMALIIGLVDALPILGTGATIIPWATMNIFMDNYHMGFGLLVLYAVIIVTRQIIEPKIVGEGIGLHPLVTLGALYIGIQVFGITGVILGPLTVIVIKALQKSEIIPDWRTSRQP